MPTPTLAVQLYTLRFLLEQDLEGTLTKLAATGVEAVETAGLYGRDAAAFRAALDAAGLAACAAHVPFGWLEATPEAACAEVAELGARTLVIPSVPPPATAAE